LWRKFPSIKLVFINDNKIVINLDHFVLTYYINSNFEYLLAAVYHEVVQSPEKDIEIIAAVQTPLTLAPFAAIIDTLSEVSGLPPSRIHIKTRHRTFVHPKATTVVLNDNDFFWIAKETIKEISHLQFEYDTDPKLFGALFGRCSFPRLDLAYYLDTCYRDHSVITFHATPKHIEDCMWGIGTVFDKHAKWAKSWCNPDHSSRRENEMGSVNFPQNLRTWPDLWGKYYIDIVVETDYHNTWDWTEKTWKCLASGKPFIHMSGPDTLHEIRRLGFKTFDPWINESYNLEPHAWRRLDLIKKEIARLASLDQTTQQTLVGSLLEIADFNKMRAREMFTINNLDPSGSWHA
jgi:hypothetical protein